ncbi:MAG: hypothetical protein ACREBJ_08660, partial [Nitrosotalea sp.]
ILSRQLIEICCLCHNSIHKIKPIIEEMNRATNDRMKYYQLDQKREAITKAVYGATGHPIILEIKADSVKARSILNEVDETAKIDKYSTLRKKYDILSEYVHPDSASNEIFGMIDIEKIDFDTLNFNDRFADQKLTFIEGVQIQEFYKDLPKEYLIAHYPRFFGMLISILNMSMEIMEESIEIGKTTHVDLVIAPSKIGELFHSADEKKKLEVIGILEKIKSVNDDAVVEEIMKILLGT